MHSLLTTVLIVRQFTDDLLRGSLSTLASCLSVTMMSRLMLNLRNPEVRPGIVTNLPLSSNSGSLE